jgi:hypothetical protein
MREAPEEPGAIGHIYRFKPLGLTEPSIVDRAEVAAK